MGILYTCFYTHIIFLKMLSERWFKGIRSISFLGKCLGLSNSLKITPSIFPMSVDGYSFQKPSKISRRV